MTVEKARKAAKLRELAARMSKRIDATREAHPPDNESLKAAFRAFADTVPAIIWTANAAGEVTFFSQCYYTLTGNSRDDWRSVIHPDDQERTRDAWAAAVASRQPYANSMRVRIADGSYQPLVTRAQPVFRDDGTVAYWLGSSSCTSAAVALPMLRLVA